MPSKSENAKINKQYRQFVKRTRKTIKQMNSNASKFSSEAYLSKIGAFDNEVCYTFAEKQGESADRLSAMLEKTTKMDENDKLSYIISDLEGRINQIYNFTGAYMPTDTLDELSELIEFRDEMKEISPDDDEENAVGEGNEE